MCGICGYVELSGKRGGGSTDILTRMTSKLIHRGPDNSAIKNVSPVSFGFTRLSIIDLAGGMQPLSNEDESLLLICNGEIFNYVELRHNIIQRGHQFKTKSDVEVILHLYEDYGMNCLHHLNGQFSFALYDIRNSTLILARDHFGILPMHYTLVQDTLIFGSEVKAILEHPLVARNSDLTALDQIFTFPGLISPRTMFRDIRSLENGHYLRIHIPTGKIDNIEYWDLVYPQIGEIAEDKPEEYYREQLDYLLNRSVELRLRSDVPVGCYLSGGLDSSLIAAKLKQLTPNVQRYTFSIDFADRTTSEGYYQRLVAAHMGSIHSERLFVETDVVNLLQKMIYYCECPVKETYNTASLALSQSVREKDIKVILTGEGADELFGGYVGYKFDQLRTLMNSDSQNDDMPERMLRKRIWGNERFFYEKDYLKFSLQKQQLYSDNLNQQFGEFDCLNSFIIDPAKIAGRDVFHIRSYVDYKLRMVDHLLSDHGDRMAMGNSVEARYPFLDIDLVKFAATIPPSIKLKDLQEKYILRQVAAPLVPEPVLKREKFGFVAPPSTYILRQNHEYINDILSYQRISRQGYFNPDYVEKLKKEYMSENFKLNIPFDNDLLVTILTFGVFLEQFEMD